MRDDINPLMNELHDLPLPKVAAVNGPAVGAGLGLALAADIVIAAQSAYFMQVFTPKLGLVPDMGVTWHLPRLIGRARAIAWSMLGERLSAEKAAAWGLIWNVVPDDKLAEEARAVAQQLARGPTHALSLLATCFDEAKGSYAAALDAEAAAQCRLVATSDAQEAVMAFREKRPPIFNGR
jgi:2-(1,2-epoxy-1,2-dihydrophenyl)acetyl-CoA isomerase